MKRIILTLSLLVATLTAGAWNNLTYATIVALASKHLTAEAAGATKQALGGEITAQNIAEKPLFEYHVDANYTSLRSDKNDALVVAEECVARLQKNRNDGEAIILLAKAIADLHGVANLRIAGHEFSNRDFNISRWNNRDGKMARYKKSGWRFLWDKYYSFRHRIMTPKLYAEDTDIYNAPRRSDYMQGNLYAWAADVAKECRVVYSRNLTDDHIFRQEEVNEFEFIHDRLMAKAGYRLAALLNELLK